jgi:class 3 adenylate cyclase
LERDFRAAYFEKSRLPLRVIGAALLVVLIAEALTEMIRGASVPETFWTVGPGVLVAAGLFAMSRLSKPPRHWEIWIAAVMLIVGALFLISRAPDLRDYPGLPPSLVVGKLFYETTVIVLVVYVVSRLRFVAATLVAWSLMAFSVAMASLRTGVPAAVIIGRIEPLLGVNLLCMLGIYAMERFLRSDFLANRLLDEERVKSERLLLNVLPAPIAGRLKEQPETIADDFTEVTVLFADIVDFTPLAARLPAAGVVHLLNQVFSRFDELAERHGLEKIKTIGDAYMVVGGLPAPRPDHAATVADMALEMQREIRRFQREDGRPLQLRIGISSGPVVAGVIGVRKFIYDLWGDTVNLASRMEAHGLPGEIQVTEEIYRLLADRYEFSGSRQVNVKGKGATNTYLLRGHAAAALADEN